MFSTTTLWATTGRMMNVDLDDVQSHLHECPFDGVHSKPPTHSCCWLCHHLHCVPCSSIHLASVHQFILWPFLPRQKGLGVQVGVKTHMHVGMPTLQCITFPMITDFHPRTMRSSSLLQLSMSFSHPLYNHCTVTAPSAQPHSLAMHHWALAWDTLHWICCSSSPIFLGYDAAPTRLSSTHHHNNIPFHADGRC